MSDTPLQTCDRCGAVTFGAACRCADSQDETRHETMRLFTPIVTISGQLNIALDARTRHG